MGAGFRRALYPYRLAANAAWEDLKRKHLKINQGDAEKVEYKTTGDVDEDLYNASQRDDVGVVEKLLKRGADALASFGDSEATSFHVCMSAAVAARLTKSLSRRVQEDLSSIRDSRGNTPLHTAARSNRLDALLGLIECGFDISLENDAGRTPAKVARCYHFETIARILEKLGSKRCWCSEESFDLEDSMQLYMKIYSFREPVICVFEHLADQKQEDMLEERNIRKKLKPLLESREERKQWEKKEEEEKTKDSSNGEEAILDLVSKAFKDLEKDLKRLEKIEKGLDDSDTDDQSSKKGNKKGKESLSVRIKTLEKELATKTDPGRWRAYKNTLGFPQDIQGYAEALIVPSLALHIRMGDGCPNRTYICKWCQKEVKLTNEEEHVRHTCSEAKIPCKKCNVSVVKRFMRSHLKNDCVGREWIVCPKCNIELRGKELSKHLKRECSERKKKCRFCQKVVLLREYDRHGETDCEDTVEQCNVYGCPAKFRKKSQRDLAIRHERMHLQKEVGKWSAAEVSYWLQTKFPFFGDFQLQQYCRRIQMNDVTGRKLKDAESNSDLRRLLKKAVGMPEDHTYTCVEALSGKSQVETLAQFPKRIRAGAFVSSEVLAGVSKWDKKRDLKWKRRLTSRTANPYVVLGSGYRR